MKFKNQTYPVLINPTNIPELTAVTVTETGVTFGSSVTLTTIEDTLRHQVNTLPGQCSAVEKSRFFMFFFLILNLVFFRLCFDYGRISIEVIDSIIELIMIVTSIALAIGVPNAIMDPDHDPDRPQN